MSRWAKGGSAYALLQAGCQGLTGAVIDALQTPDITASGGNVDVIVRCSILRYQVTVGSEGVANDETVALFFEVTFTGRHLSCDAAAI